MSRIEEITKEICKMYAEGTRPKVIAETLQVDISKVYNARNLHSDLIAEYKGRKMDGTPLVESLPTAYAPYKDELDDLETEDFIESVHATQITANAHSISELFQQIAALQNQNDDLKKELECAYSNHADEQERRIEVEKQLADIEPPAFKLDKEKIMANVKDIFSCVIDCIFKLGV